jgi:hypothetical protein
MRKGGLGVGGLVVVCALAGCGGEPELERSQGAAVIRQTPGSCREDAFTVVSARASAEESDHFRAGFAVDGDEATRWSSGRASTAWLILDLGQRRTIKDLQIDWERAFSPSYWVQASDNAVNWATIAITGATQPGPQFLSELDTTARYLRILSQKASSFGNVSIKEATVLGDPDLECLDKTTICGASVLLPVARAQASSTEFSYTPASAAVDGVYSTRWSSHFTDNEWLAVDLGGDARIDFVAITWEHAFAKRYALQAGPSLNGPWTTVVTDAGQFGTELSPQLGVTTRYLRLLGVQRATQYGYSVWELDVYGSLKTTCP